MVTGQVSGQGLVDDILGAISGVATLVYGIPGAIGDQLQGAVDTIAGVVDSVRNSVDGMLGVAVSSIGQSVANASASIANTIYHETDAILSPAIATVQWVVNGISREVSAVAGTVGEITTSITNSLVSLTNSLIPDALTAIWQAVEAVRVMSVQVSESLNDITDLPRAVADYLSANWERAKEPLETLARVSIPSAIRDLLHGLELEFPAEIDAVLDLVADNDSLPEPIRDLLGLVKRREAPLMLLVLLPLLGAMVMPFASAAMAPAATKLGYVMNEWQRPAIPSLTDSAVADQRGLLPDGWWTKLGAMNGLSDEFITIVRQLANPLLDPSSLLQLWLRGTLGDSDLEQRLGQHGYSSEQAAHLRTLSMVLPTPSDLVRFLVREVYTPATRSEYGLDADFPTTSLPLFRQLGMSEELARDYWAAHWELPSPTQGYEMLHRGLITEQQLSDLLKALDVMPRWRQPLMDMSFSPLTRVDVRRMHKLGVLDRSGVVKAYRDVGYSPANAESLATFTERLNAQETAYELEPFRAPVKTQLQRAYRNGLLTAEAASNQLERLGYPRASAAAYVAEMDLAREQDQADTLRDAVKRQYVYGYWTREQTSEYLAARGFVATEIDYSLARWDLEREYRDLSETEKANRDLTKGELVNAYEERLLTRDAADNALQAVGYSQSESSTLLALADVRVAKATAAAEKARIEAQYRARQIDRGTASAELDALGITASHRQALIARWDVAIDTATPELSLALVEKLLGKQIVTEAEAEVELAAMGYSNKHRQWLLTLWTTADQSSAGAKLRKTKPVEVS